MGGMMNERIKELEKQCWDHQTNHLNAEKFAELIIRECADIANINQFQWNSVGYFVLKHFGIEEN